MVIIMSPQPPPPPPPPPSTAALHRHFHQPPDWLPPPAPPLRRPSAWLLYPLAAVPARCCARSLLCPLGPRVAPRVQSHNCGVNQSAACDQCRDQVK